METRKLYIIASLIVLVLVTGLAFWYLYIAKQEAQIGEVSELDIYGANNNFSINSTPSATTNTAVTAATDTTTSKSVAVVDDSIQKDVPSETWVLTPLHTDPVANAYIKSIQADGDLSTLIQFTERKTGNILESNSSGEKYRLSGITLPRSVTSYFLSDGSVLVESTDGGVPTLINTDQDDANHKLSNLPSNLMQIAQYNSSIYYTASDDTGVALMVIPESKLDAKNYTAKQLWSSPLSGWLIQPVANFVIVTQKASYDIPGYSYLISKSDGRVMQMLQDMPALITNVSPDAKQVLYSISDKHGVRLYLQDTSTNSTPIELSINTLASKCLWGTDSTTFYCAIPSSLPAKLPDNWYRGEVHFNDSLWRINSATGDAFRLAHATGLDIIDLTEGGGILIFKNKTDQTLWMIKKDNYNKHE